MNLLTRPSTRFLLLSTTALLTCAPLAQAVDVPATHDFQPPMQGDFKAVEVRPGVYRLEPV